MNSYHGDETRYSTNFTFSETFKEAYSTQQNFMLLSLRSHEISGGPHNTPPPSWHPMWAPKPLVPKGLRGEVRSILRYTDSFEKKVA